MKIVLLVIEKTMTGRIASRNCDYFTILLTTVLFYLVIKVHAYCTHTHNTQRGSASLK